MFQSLCCFFCLGIQPCQAQLLLSAKHAHQRTQAWQPNPHELKRVCWDVCWLGWFRCSPQSYSHFMKYSFSSSVLNLTWKVSGFLMVDVVLSWMYAAILRIEQNHAKSIQERNFTSGEILGFRMISSLNGFRPKFWTEGDLGIYGVTFTINIPQSC